MSTTTAQITCAGDDFCPAFAISASFQPVSPKQQAAKLRRDAADDGWTDHEGRDYCPDHNPLVPPTP